MLKKVIGIEVFNRRRGKGLNLLGLFRVVVNLTSLSLALADFVIKTAAIFFNWTVYIISLRLKWHKHK